MPITINPSPTPKNPLTTAEKLARLRASRNGGGGSSSVPKSSIPKAPLSGKTINNTLPESPTRKFWEDDSFKQYVQTIKKPAPAPQQPTSPAGIASVGIPSLINQIIQKQRMVNNLLLKYPKNEQGQIPLLDASVQMGNRLYLDSDKMIFTDSPSDTPLYLDDNNILTPNNTGKWAIFDSTLAETMLNDYSQFAESFSTVIANTSKGEKVYQDTTIESLEQSRKLGLPEIPEGTPFYVSVDGSRQPTVISFDKPSKVLQAIGESGDWTRDVMLQQWNIRKSGSEEQTIGIDLVDDPTGYVAIGLVSGLFNFISKGLQTIVKNSPYSREDWVKGTYNKQITSLIDRGAKQAIVNAGKDSELESHITDIAESAKEQILEAQKDSASAYAFESWKDVGDFLLNLGGQASNVATYTPSKLDLKSQYELKTMAVQGHNDAHTDYDLLDPIGRKQAEDKLVETYQIERRIGVRDLFASWSGATDPQIEEKILRAVAQVELMKGKELNAEEIDQIKYYFADPSVEFAGQTVFDVANLLNIPASAVFSDDALKAIAKMTGVRNVAEKQLDGLIISSLFRGTGKALGAVGDIVGKGLRKIDAVDDLVKGIFKRNLYNPGLIPFSDRFLTRKIYQNSADMFNNLFGKSTKLIWDVPTAQFDEINKLGLEISSLRKHGFTEPDEIIILIQKERKFSPLISNKGNIRAVMAMVDIIDPGTIKGSKGWADMFANAFGKSRNLRRVGIMDDLAQKISKRINNPEQLIGDAELDKIFEQYLTQAPDQQSKFIATEIANLAKIRANKAVTADDVASSVSSIFGDAYKNAHTIKYGKGKLLWERSFSGFLDKSLTKGAEALNKFKKGSGTGLTLARDGVRFLNRVQSAVMEGWVRNILTRSPKYTMVQQPLEQYMTYLLSGSGGIVSRSHNYLTNTPELLEMIGEMPVATHTGFVSMLDVDVNATKFTQGIIDFYTKNPKVWRPMTGSYNMFFNDSMRRDYATWLDRFLEDKGITGIKERADFLKKASQNKKLIGFVDAPNGRVMTVLGVPMNPVKQISSAWGATAEAGADLASASELITKAKIAQENFLNTKRFVNNAFFDELANGVRAQMKTEGASDELIEEFVGNARRIWDDAGGNASTFYEGLNLKINGTTPVTFAGMPDELSSMPLAMTQQERDNFLINTRKSLNEYLTELNATNQPIDQKSIHKFFKDTLDALKKETEESINPGGLNAFGTMGELSVKRPISADTQKLLDDIDTGNAPTKLTQTIKRIFVEDNGLSLVDEAGNQKTIQQLIDELNESVRPIGWKAPEVKQAEAMQAVNESLPTMSVKDTPNEKVRTKTTLDELFRERPDVTISEKGGAGQFFSAPEDTLRAQDRRDYVERLTEAVKDGKKAKEMELEASTATFKYRESIGRLNGVAKSLRESLANTPDDINLQNAVRTVDNAIQNVGEMNTRMFGLDGMAAQVYPGTKLQNPIIGDPHDAFMAEHYQSVAYYTSASESIGRIVDGIEIKAEGVIFPTRGDLSVEAGWDVIPNQNGFDIDGFIYRDPATGQETPFMRGTQVFDRMQSNDYFGFKNMDNWNAPIVLSQTEYLELGLKSQPSVPLIMVNGVPIPAERQLIVRDEFMRAYVSKPYFDDKPLWFYIEPFVEGRDIDNIDAQTMVGALRKAANSNDVFAQKSLNELADHLEHVDNYFYHNHILGDKHYDIPFSSKSVPDDIRANAHTKIANASQLQGIKKAFKVWEKNIIEQADGNLLVLNKLRGKVSDDAARIFADGAAQFQETLWHGGKVAGIDVEGAVNYANQRMRVGSETIIDQFAKGLVPFWNFSTRGSMTWARFIAEHPQIARTYQKYLKFGRGQALTGGLVNRLGQPLPSSLGKMRLVKIGGQDIWFNPMSVTSPFVAYFFPLGAVEKYDDEDPSMTDFQTGIRNGASALRARGVRLGPAADIVMSMYGIDDNYTTQDWKQKIGAYVGGSMLPVDLLPPFIWNAIDSTLRKAEYPNKPDTWRPEVEWMDYLVEMKILEDYLGKIRNEPDETKRLDIAITAKELIDLREKSDTYNDYVNQVRGESYCKQVAGYFTGLYPTIYTAGEYELFAIRDKINLLRTSINDTATRTIFFPYSGDKDVYNAFEDLRWETGLGELWNTRSNVSWVTDKRGNQLEGTDRREKITQINNLRQLREEMYAEIQSINDEYEAANRKLNLGLDYNDPLYKEAGEKRTKALLNIYTSPKYSELDTPWNTGLKPQSMIDEQIGNMLYYLVNDTKPTYISGVDDWDEHQKEVEAWNLNVNNIAREVAPILMNTLVQTNPEAYAGQDVIGVVDKMVSQVNAEFITAYDKRNDTVYDAAVNAWFEQYMRPYMDTVWKESGARRKQAEIAFYDNVPKPTSETISLWITQNYGDKFSPEEIEDALTSPDSQDRKILDVEEGLAVGDTEVDKIKDDIWNFYGMVPKSKKSKLYDEINLVGLSSAFDTFMNTGGVTAGRDVEIETLRDAISKIVGGMNLPPLTENELGLQVDAQNMNDNLTQMITMQVGDGWESIMHEWGQLKYANRKKWETQNPEKADIRDTVYAMKDQFGRENPLWAYYYTTNTLSHPPTATSDGRKTTAEKLAELRAKREQ